MALSVMAAIVKMSKSWLAARNKYRRRYQPSFYQYHRLTNQLKKVMQKISLAQSA